MGRNSSDGGRTGGSLGGRIIRTRKRGRRPNYTKAEEVTITRPDGTTETRPPYTPREYQRRLKGR